MSFGFGLNFGLGTSGAGGGSSEFSYETDAPFIISAWEVTDDVSSTFDNPSHDFAPADVNIANNTIDFGEDIFFNAPNESLSTNLGVFVRFSTTGTLPSGLEADTDYYIAKDTGTLYKVYKVSTDADRDNLDNMAMNETVFPAQGLLQRNLVIDITDQGSGTHTLYTDSDLIYKWYDKLSGFPLTSGSSTDRNSFFEILRNENGKYLTLKTMVNTPENGKDDKGKRWAFGDGDTYLDIKNAVENKKTLVQGFYGTYVYYNLEGEARDLAKSVDTSTDRITLEKGSFSYRTGSKIEFKPYVGATLPAGLSANTTYYAREISNTVLEVYTTLSDANAGTNKVDITSTGTGNFTVIFTEYVNDRNNWGFLFEQNYPDNSGENFVVGMGAGKGYNAGIYNVDNGTLPYKTGGFNGRWAALNSWPDLTRLRVFKPKDAVLLRDDNSVLESGIYYKGGGDNGCEFALYDTLEDAQYDIDNDVSLSASTRAIKFNGTAGIGEYKIMALDIREQFVSADDDSLTDQMPFLNYEEEGLFLWVLRANDPAASFMEVDFYFNGELLATAVSDVPKSDMPASNDISNSLGLVFNSSVPHVSMNARLKAFLWGATDTQLGESDIQALNTYLSNKSWS